MFLGFLSLVKGKLFGQVGSFLLPIFGLLAVFVIWNSDLILTKFGYETRTNLKAQVTGLKAELALVKGANKDLTTTITRVNDGITITEVAMDQHQTAKDNTKTTVGSLIEERKKKAEKTVPACEAPEELPLPPPENPGFKTETRPTPARTQPSVSVVNSLSRDNIETINKAYAVFFPGASQ